MSTFWSRVRYRELGAKCLLVFVTSFVTSAILDRAMGFFVRPGSAVQVAHPPNFHDARASVEFSYEFRTNSMGLRYRELPLNKQSDSEFRAVVVGDSFVEGWGVNDAERFSSLLEESLSTSQRPTYFINAGLSGTGPLQYGRMLFAVGMQLHPDLALIVIYANDPDDTPANGHLDLDRTEDGRFVVRSRPSVTWPPGSTARRIASRVWPWSYGRLRDWSVDQDATYLKSLGFWGVVHERARRLGISEAAYMDWKARVPEQLWKAVERKQFNGYLLVPGLFAPDSVVDSLDIQTKEAEAKWSAMQQILSDTVSVCRQSVLTCAVIYAPAAFQYDRSAGSALKAVGIRVRPEWLNGQSGLEQRLESWAAQARVPYFSLTNDFRTAAAAEPPGFYNFELDGHWNANGHKLAARAIERWLDEQGLVPGRK